MAASRFAVLALIAANLVPLAGVAFLGWELFDVMMIYWLENGVIGVFNLVRMATAGRAPASTVFFGPFFTVHYGMFWLVHGTFVITLFGPGDGPFGIFPGVAPAPAVVPGVVPALTLPLVGPVPVSAGVGWAVAGVALSHGVSFVRNWWIGGERNEMSPADLMRRPYARVVILHVTLLAGGFIVTALGGPLAALAVMVLLKIAVDLHAHLREHRASRARATPTAPVSPARAR